MTTQSLVYRTTYASRSRTRELLAEHTKWVKSLLPRPCMIVSGGLLVTGLSVPFLMGLTIIPASLFLGFVGMLFTCLGCVLTLYYL